MPQKKYLITLEDAEREQREPLLHSGGHATRKVTRARMLLKAAEGWGRWRSVRAPEGRQRWTFHGLANRVVARGLAASSAYESVRRV